MLAVDPEDPLEAALDDAIAHFSQQHASVAQRHEPALRSLSALPCETFLRAPSRPPAPHQPLQQPPSAKSALSTQRKVHNNLVSRAAGTCEDLLSRPLIAAFRGNTSATIATHQEAELVEQAAIARQLPRKRAQTPQTARSVGCLSLRTEAGSLQELLAQC